MEEAAAPAVALAAHPRGKVAGVADAVLAPATPSEQERRSISSFAWSTWCKYNLAVSIIHRVPTNAQAGTPIASPYHDFTAGQGSYSRRLQAGDIVIIPPGVLHVWTEIPIR
jgi:hypothetical protein